MQKQIRILSFRYYTPFNRRLTHSAALFSAKTPDLSAFMELRQHILRQTTVRMPLNHGILRPQTPIVSHPPLQMKLMSCAVKSGFYGNFAYTPLFHYIFSVSHDLFYEKRHAIMPI